MNCSYESGITLKSNVAIGKFSFAPKALNAEMQVLFAEGAGRSVWYDRRVRNAEAAGSNPARSTELFRWNQPIDY